MSARRAPWVGLVGLVVAVGLPVAGNWARHRAAGTCALDGMKIDPVYRVEVVDFRGRAEPFCCLKCAEMWLKNRSGQTRTIRVTDEASGEVIDADTAVYVRSSVVTMPTTGNRVHVFRNRADAEKHAAAHAGIVLSESERPFPRP
jgi:nitrous oxide reductase accessory protein NosL